uniref:Uncharacterized protein n=1 Tax=Arundo donax TaxID=35708 RepID=A0A0A9GSI3_ARUDO
MAPPRPLSVEDVLRVNGSRRFAATMAAASPFASLADALLAARRIWLDEVDVNGWLEAFPLQVGGVPSLFYSSCQFLPLVSVLVLLLLIASQSLWLCVNFVTASTNCTRNHLMKENNYLSAVATPSVKRLK